MDVEVFRATAGAACQVRARARASNDRKSLQSPPVAAGNWPLASRLATATNSSESLLHPHAGEDGAMAGDHRRSEPVALGHRPDVFPLPEISHMDGCAWLEADIGPFGGDIDGPVSEIQECNRQVTIRKELPPDFRVLSIHGFVAHKDTLKEDSKFRVQGIQGIQGIQEDAL